QFYRPENSLRDDKKRLSAFTLASFMAAQFVDDPDQIRADVNMSAELLKYLLGQAIGHWSRNHWLNNDNPNQSFSLSGEGIKKVRGRLEGQAGKENVTREHVLAELQIIHGHVQSEKLKPPFNFQTPNDVSHGRPVAPLLKLDALTPEHREALNWFHEHKGQEVSWPAQMANGMFLVNKAKGIHKPAGSQYALSIRESLGGPYPDREPKFNPDGSWTYEYFQEQLDPSKRDRMYTNVALLACKRDEIPVGVIRQVKAKPNPRYQVLGLALVREWENGHFNLEGLSSGPPNPVQGNDTSSSGEDDFDPESIEDARKKTLAAIVCRQGQGKFRRLVLAAYEGHCALSGCDVPAALEAAHIYGYMGEETNVVENGLLLRADIHTLYDLGLIAIDPASMTVVISPKLQATTYSTLGGAPVRLPVQMPDRPSRVAIEMHWTWAKGSWEA
ncbi:HNH endonuclease, partial [Pseudoduganella sp. RAF53_2]